MQRGGNPKHISTILPGVLEALGDRRELAQLLAPFEEDEARLQAFVAGRMAEHGLEVFREVCSTDGKSRIDLVVWDMATGFRAGIEVKIAGRKRGKELGDWLRQGMRYAEARFPVPGAGGQPIPLDVYLFPQVSGLYLDEGEFLHPHPVLGHRQDCGPSHNVCTLLGSFGLGELQLYRRSRWQQRQSPGREFGWRYVMKADVRWSTDKRDTTTIDLDEPAPAGDGYAT